MAVTDVAPLVTPTYTATLNVTNDGSVLTQAALTSLAVSLANRTEFLRDLIAEASDTPEAYCTLREEFLGSVWDSGQSLLQGNVQWRTTATGSVSVSGNAGASKNPGLLNVSVPGDGASNEKFIFFLENATGAPFSFLKFQEMTVVVKVIRDVANITDRVHFGLADDADDQAGGDDAILISHLGANTKWQLVRRVAGVQTTTTLTLADFADSEFAVWHLTRPAGGGTGLEIYLNGDLVHTIDGVDMPGGSCNFTAYQEVTAADTELHRVSWDLIAIRTKPNDRSGA